jgi:hypothetical protein
VASESVKGERCVKSRVRRLARRALFMLQEAGMENSITSRDS